MYPRMIRKTGLKGSATPKQIEYAESISKVLGIDLPESKSKQKISDFISAYAVKYKKVIVEGRGL